MSVLDGTIDYLGRPRIKLEVVAAGARQIDCLLDTGFNRSLLMSRNRAESVGFRSFDPMIVTSVSTGHYKAVACEVMSGSIRWFGETLELAVHAVQWEPAGTAEDAPEALLGTELLRGLHVFLDFQFGRVLLQKPYPAHTRPNEES